MLMLMRMGDAEYTRECREAYESAPRESAGGDPDGGLNLDQCTAMARGDQHLLPADAPPARPP